MTQRMGRDDVKPKAGAYKGMTVHRDFHQAPFEHVGWYHARRTTKGNEKKNWTSLEPIKHHECLVVKWFTDGIEMLPMDMLDKLFCHRIGARNPSVDE